MPDQPNVLLIHAHDLGRRLGCLGARTVHSPNLDAFAASGVRCENAFTVCPTCSPSRAVLFTGRYPVANGVLGMCPSSQGWDLKPDTRHIAQILGDAGYATAAVGVHHESSSGPERCGFASYDADEFAEPATDAAIGRLAELGAGTPPFYLQVALFEPHRIHLPGDETDGFIGDHIEPDESLGLEVPGYLRDTPGTREELAEFQGAVRHLDHHVGRLLAALDEQGLSENTLVVFTTDHGAAFPRAKVTLHDPGVETALLLRLPGRPGWHGGRTVSHLLSNVDILPTILAAAGVPAPEELQGRSFAPLLDDDDYVPREEVFCEQTYHGQYDPKRGIRTDRYKLFLNLCSGHPWQDCSQSWRPRSDPAVSRRSRRRLVELYDLAEDPWELDNRCDDPALMEVRDDLLDRLHRHMQAIGDPILAGPVDGLTRQAAMGLIVGDSRGQLPEDS